MTRKKQGDDGGFTPNDDQYRNPAPGAELFDQGGQHPDTPTFRIPGLTPAQRIFCNEYATTRNATESYQRAHPNVTRLTAGTEGNRLLHNPLIREEVQRLLDESASITGITRERVLMRLWNIATADPRKLTELRKGACRHCWGMYHQYQYTDAEYEKAESDWIHKEAKRQKAEKADFEPQAFPRKGGTGYHPDRQPNPECPECFGEGTTRVVLHDTRTLEPAEAALFAGVKVSEKGAIEVKTHNPVEALIQVGRHLGMWNDKLLIPTESTNPLAELLRTIQQSNASALPLVAEDPDLKDRPDVQDVQAKPEKKAPAWRPA
jgi:phage terminase small subunit